MDTTDMKDNDKIEKAILEGLSLCRGVVQRYLAHIQGVEAEMLFPQGVQPTNAIGFMHKGETLWLKLDIVNKDHVFDIERCNATVVRETMAKIINNLHPAAQWVLTQDITPDTILARPELFVNARIAVAPNTTAFLYTPADGKEGRSGHDDFDKRIGFVWSL